MFVEWFIRLYVTVTTLKGSHDDDVAHDEDEFDTLVSSG